MKLHAILKGIKVLNPVVDLEQSITEICSDSRLVTRGALFVAIKGTQTDGHQHLSKAISQGAETIVCEQLPAILVPHITYIQVADSEGSLGKMASNFYGNPSALLTLVGITGTNGKTTIATLLYQTFQLLGYRTGLLSTICNYINESKQPATHTTPDPLSLNRLLAEMVSAGCTHVFMEVSSHAIHQKRISGLTFAGGVFTNLTRDHLDYHQTVDAYLNAKKSFFDHLPKTAFALTNVDDKTGLVMLQNSKAKKQTYSLKGLADFKGRIVENHFEGMILELNNCEIAVQFIGKFNASNLLAVLGVTTLLGNSLEKTLLAISQLKPVSGRFETISSTKGYTAIVDYAHTPDAILNVLTAIREVQNGKGQLITVIGAGGNRDKGKRPLMAQEAVKGSDKVIFTADNPRFEEPQAIIDEMLAGLSSEKRRNVLTILDRSEAIKTAVMLAHSGDVILVAGKGHENYQEIKGVKHPFDDKEILIHLGK